MAADGDKTTVKKSHVDGASSIIRTFTDDLKNLKPVARTRIAIFIAGPDNAVTTTLVYRVGGAHRRTGVADLPIPNAVPRRIIIFYVIDEKIIGNHNVVLLITIIVKYSTVNCTSITTKYELIFYNINCILV